MTTPRYGLDISSNMHDTYQKGGDFTNVAGQEAPTSASCGRNARFSDVFLFLALNFAKIYDIMILVKKERFVYATNNYSKTSDFNKSF